MMDLLRFITSFIMILLTKGERGVFWFRTPGMNLELGIRDFF